MASASSTISMHFLQLSLPVRRLFQLFFRDFRSGARKPCEIKRQVFFQFREPAGSGQDSLHLNRVIAMEINAIEASVRAASLILRAHRFLQQVTFYVYRFSRQSVLIAHLIFQRIQTQKKSHCKRGTSAQAGARRQVRHVVNLHSIAIPMNCRQARTEGCSINLLSLTFSTFE